MDLLSLTASDLSNKCLEAFQTCLTFRSADPGLSNHHATHDGRFEYRLADFNLWIDGIGTPGPSKASLDVRLSERPIDLTLVKGNLVMLFQSLEDCSNLLKENGSLEDALLDIDSALESLATLSLSIRRIGRRSRLHKADRLFKPEEHAELRKHLEAIIVHRPGPGPRSEGDEFQTKMEPLTPLQNRLVTANLKRRNRFIQAQLHSLGLKKRSEDFELPAPEALQQTPSPVPSSSKTIGDDAFPTKSDATEKARKLMQAPMAVTSALIPESKLQYKEPVAERAVSSPMTVITQITASSCYPRPRISDNEQKVVRCPCCCQTLPVSEAKNNNRWRMHLADDIRPYTCIFDRCPTPDVYYSSRSMLEQHFRQDHPPVWVCPLCDATPVHPTMSEMMDHLHDTHSQNSSEDISSMILSAAQKRMGIESCPLCEVKGVTDSPELIDHVLEHVHDFSLRSLPWPRPSEVDIGGEVGSSGTECVESAAITEFPDGNEQETEQIDPTLKLSTCDHGKSIDIPDVAEAMEALNLNTGQTIVSSPADEPSSDSNAPNELSPNETLSLICPISVLAICASPFQPAPHDMLWRTQIQIAAGSYGKISVGTLLKSQMNPYLTHLSGRKSRWPGEIELVAFKSPNSVDNVITEIYDRKETPGTVHSKDIIPELTLLATPMVLYHENIIDLLGYVWEPYDGVGRAGRVDQVRYAPTLILEFTELGSLRLFLDCVSPLDINSKIRLCADICQALITLHHEIKVMDQHVGVFHGDLKPENILIFEDKAEGCYVAKLCDLGSCIRYSHDTPLHANEVPPGTKGWGSPEATGSHDQLVHPLFSEIFSFGLLVAYIILGMDAYQIPEVAEFLKTTYFSSVADRIPSQASGEDLDMNGAQQWMINNHFDLFVDSIFRAVHNLNLPEREDAIVRSVLHQTLVFVPEQRAHRFSDIFDSLDLEYKKSKYRTPIEPIMNTMEDPTSRISINWALALVTATATMDHLFHEWLGQHLEVVFNHLTSKNSSTLTSVISHVALLRGLLAFLPPNVGSKMATGEMWLTRAASYGDPDVSVLAYRLLRAQGHDCSTDFTNCLVRAAKAGSILARQSGVVPPSLITDIDENVFLASVQDSFQENAIWPMHLLAFLRDDAEVQSLVEIFVGQEWNLQTETWLGIDQVNGGYLTYSMPMPGTALHWAVQMNNLAAVKALVEAGATPYTFTERRRNAWAVAVGARLLPIIKYFVESCACTDDTSRSQWTVEALFYGLAEAYLACGERYVEASCETFRYLFDKGILPRQEAYASTVSLGSGDSRLLGRLLDEDYDEERDLALVKRLLIDAVINGDVSAVQILLGHLPRFETSDYSIHALTAAITSRAAEDDAIFQVLLQHLSPAFDVNVRFTHLHVKAHQSPVISEIEGHTLLHSAFDHGKINMAIQLLYDGADPTILSIDEDAPGAGMTAFGRLFFANTHHNYLALKAFLQSEYVRDHPDFVVDNAVIIPASNRNVFHFLTSDEDFRLHYSAVKTTVLNELLRYLRNSPSSKAKVKDLLNAQTLEAGGEFGLTPLYNAAVSGFADAVSLLESNGADPLLRILADPDNGIPGLTPLHAVDTRSQDAWRIDWSVHEKTFAMNGVPWFDMRAPVAQKLASDYEKRTWGTIRAFRDILSKGSARRELWEKRRMFRSQEGLRVE